MKVAFVKNSEKKLQLFFYKKNASCGYFLNQVSQHRKDTLIY